MRKPSPSRSNRVPISALHSRVAFASIAWNTGCSSPGELLMTRSTSEAAVCCSSASLRSRVSNATFFFRPATEAPRWREAAGALRGDAFTVLRRFVIRRLVRSMVTRSPEKPRLSRSLGRCGLLRNGHGGVLCDLSYPQPGHDRGQKRSPGGSRVQKMGGGRWDTSRLIALLDRYGLSGSCPTRRRFY